MTTKLIAKNTVQITCSQEEHNLFIHALVSTLVDDEDFVKRYGNDKTLFRNIESCRKSIELEKRMLEEIIFS